MMYFAMQEKENIQDKGAFEIYVQSPNIFMLNNKKFYIQKGSIPMYTQDQNSQKYPVLLWLHTIPDPRASTLQGQNPRSENKKKAASHVPNKLHGDRYQQSSFF